MPDDALGVQEKHRTRVYAALAVEHAVGRTDAAVGPVVRQQGEGNAAEGFRPGLQAGNGIGADLEDFDVELLEFFVVRTEPADLVLSTAGEGQGQEGYDGASTFEGGQREAVAQVRCQRKIRRR